MTADILFGPDCASYQGDVDWLKVSAVCAFGAEKVTEGTSYVNPRWAAAKKAMRERSARGGFISLAYLFLDATGSGMAQARHFADAAGDLSHFGIVIDCETAPDGPPSLAQASDASDMLRHIYRHHPIGGYAPKWYTGGQRLSFFNWLWASSYVIGSGDPGVLYNQVPAAWWAPYGEMSPLLLQFTDKASIAGINGPVDCSAFHGSRARLAAAVLPRLPAPLPPPPKRPVTHGDDMVIIPLVPGAAPVHIPVWADAASYREPVSASYASLVLAGDTGTVVQATVCHSDKAPEVFTPALATGADFPIVPSHGWATVRTVRLCRLDTKPALGATAIFRTW